MNPGATFFVLLAIISGGLSLWINTKPGKKWLKNL